MPGCYYEPEPQPAFYTRPPPRAHRPPSRAHDGHDRGRGVIIQVEPPPRPRTVSPSPTRLIIVEKQRRRRRSRSREEEQPVPGFWAWFFGSLCCCWACYECVDECGSCCCPAVEYDSD